MRASKEEKEKQFLTVQSDLNYLTGCNMIKYIWNEIKQNKDRDTRDNNMIVD